MCQQESHLPSASEWADAQMSLTEESVILGQHISSVVHELSNPLTIILLQAQLLRKAVCHSPQAARGLTIIQNQAERMRRMVQDLLAYAGPASTQCEMTDINALLGATLEQQRMVQSGNVQWIAELNGNLPEIEADPDRLQQVFVNIINNAQQAIDSSNGSTGSAPQRRGQVRITTALVHNDRDEQAQIRIRFDDDGPGIPSEVMPYIFEPFFTTKRSGEGTGLGLSICERIVRDHGGRIWAENNDEGGATFVVELPAIAPAEKGQPALDEDATAQNGSGADLASPVPVPICTTHGR